MKRKLLILTLSSFVLTGCSITIESPNSSPSSPETSATVHSVDYQSGKSYANGSWQQQGFRDLFGTNPSKTTICNYITSSTITGFNALNGFQNNKERDFYSGCIAWFTEQGY